MGKQRVIDSHVHLYPLENFHYLDMSEDDVMHRNHTLTEYMRYNDYQNFDVEGVVVVEMNVISSLDEDGWANPIEEFVYHTETLSQNHLIKAIIPWAPIPLGPTQVEKYISLLQMKSSTENFDKVKGFRYVLQDKPPGTMLDEQFIESLKLLLMQNYVFDVGVNVQQDTMYQFQELVKLVKSVPNMKFIIDHLSKPDYSDCNSKEFHQWLESMSSVTRFGHCYIKLSGCFEELPDNYVKEHTIEQIVAKLLPWFKVILKLFGKKRIMFGSNWPMDNTNGDKYDENGFNTWCQVVELLLTETGFSPEELQDVYRNNALALFNIEDSSD